MNARSSRPLIVTFFLAALFVGLSLTNLSPKAVLVPACAQQNPCPQMNVGGNSSLTWPPGATVKVFFDVAADRRAIYEQVLNNWSTGNGQGVTFVFDVETGQAQYSMFISDAIPNGDNSLRGTVAYQGWDANGVLQYADIQINPNVTDPTALANAMSHEISHNFGLNHPADSSNPGNLTSSALYNRANGLNDTTTGSPGPTPCDNQVINSIYASGGVKYVALTIGDGGGGSGGGGGSDYYDPGYYCTPYYWVYLTSYDGGETWEVNDIEYAGCW